MVGTSCVLITTSLNQKESRNQNVANFILSSPIKRRLTTPDRLYRMMQWEAAQSLGVGVELADD
jgi:hypothetical protein